MIEQQQRQQHIITTPGHSKPSSNVRFKLRKSQEDRIEMRANAQVSQQVLQEQEPQVHTCLEDNDNYPKRPMLQALLHATKSGFSESIRSLCSSSRSLTGMSYGPPSEIPNGSSIAISSRMSYLKRSRHGSYHGTTHGDASSAARLLQRAERIDLHIQDVVESSFIALISPEECVLDTDGRNDDEDNLNVIGEGSFGQVICVNEVRLRDSQFHRKHHNRRRQNSRGSTKSDNESEFDESSQMEDKVTVKRQSEANTESKFEVCSEIEDKTKVKVRLKRTQSYVSLKVDEKRKELTLDRLQIHNRTDSKMSDIFSSSNNSSAHSTSSLETTPLSRKSYFRFAMKKCKRVKDYEASAEAALDLAHEACLLATFSHPNLCKLHAISTRPVLSSGFFILLEYLPCTLEKNLRKWKGELETKKRFKFLTVKKSTKMSLLRKRISQAAAGIASALEYLHSCDIIYRDIKQDNIGFSVDGKVKLFDFGLSKQLPLDNDEDETFRMTRVGAPRYMAPEIIMDEPYNRAADVYSFAILLWEICSLSEAYSGLGRGKHFEKVVKGVRPRLSHWWPKDLRELFQGCWISDFKKRYKFKDIVQVLNSTLTE